MATFDNLPVYKACYDLLVEIFKFTSKFSREYKYTLAERLKNETINFLKNIFRDNSALQKFDILQKACENTEIVRL